MRLLFFCLKRPFRRWPRLSTFFHRSWISTGPPLLRRTPTQQILRDDSWARRWQSSHAGFSKSSILKVSCISACHIGIMGIAVLSARPSALQQRLPDNFLNLKNDAQCAPARSKHKRRDFLIDRSDLLAGHRLRRTNTGRSVNRKNEMFILLSLV